MDFCIKFIPHIFAELFNSNPPATLIKQYFKKISEMSLAFDEFGRPYLIVRDQAQKRRLKGADAYKVTFSSPSSNLNRPT